MFAFGNRMTAGALLALGLATAASPAVAQAPEAAPRSKPASVVERLRALAPPPVIPRFNDVMTAVLYRDREAVAQLLDLGRWVDKPDSNGLTPLMVAVMMGESEMAALLLERGADPQLQAPGGDIALDIARANGHGAIEQLLLDAERRR
jgi:ankyrin repeat protein